MLLESCRCERAQGFNYHPSVTGVTTVLPEYHTLSITLVGQRRTTECMLGLEEPLAFEQAVSPCG